MGTPIPSPSFSMLKGGLRGCLTFVAAPLVAQAPAGCFLLLGCSDGLLKVFRFRCPSPSASVACVKSFTLWNLVNAQLLRRKPPFCASCTTYYTYYWLLFHWQQTSACRRQWGRSNHPLCLITPIVCLAFAPFVSWVACHQ